MNTIKSIEKILNIKNTVVTIGNFDGLHKGHQVLINKAIEYAKKHDLKSVVFTFENHPANYFFKDAVKRIDTNKQKIKILEKMGVDIVVNIKFDDYMTQISSYDFIKEILVDRLDAKKIIVGHDFTFARNKEGTIETLEKLRRHFRFELEVVKPIKINDMRVSSTHIRDLIKDGKVDEISKYLGRNYILEGEVIHCKKIGRTIGFPTANLSIGKNTAIPKVGVYATKVYIGNDIFTGATNIGYNPTVSGQGLSIETHIINFNKDIYGQIIAIEFLERIRDEKKFNSIDDLKNQLEEDTNYICKNYICKV